MKTVYLLISLLFVTACASSKKAVTTDSRCAEKPDPGSCRAAKPRYFFDKTTGKCSMFYWGGCGGIVPFNSLEECKKACGCKP